MGPPDRSFQVKAVPAGIPGDEYDYTVKALGTTIATFERLQYQRGFTFQRDVNNLPEGNYKIQIEAQNLSRNDDTLGACETNTVTVSKDIGQEDCQISITPNPPKYDREINVEVKNLAPNNNNYKVRVMGPNNHDSGLVGKGATDSNGNFNFIIGPYSWEGAYTLDIYEGKTPICKQYSFNFTNQDQNCIDTATVISSAKSCFSRDVKPKVPCYDLNSKAGFKCPSREQIFCATTDPALTSINDIGCEIPPPLPPPCSKFVDAQTGRDVTDDVNKAIREGRFDPSDPNKFFLNFKCAEVKTGILDIDTRPEKFVGSIMGLILGLSGGIAVLLIIVSGYRLMASQGNPEKVQGAKESLTSAIVGLLFIIFALVILQVIGVDILQLPGFDK